MVQTLLYWRNPTKEDIRLGYGPIIFREFSKKICLNENGKPHLSIITDDDKLRYYSAYYEYFTTSKYNPVRIKCTQQD